MKFSNHIENLDYLSLAALLATIGGSAKADNFGSGVNTFTIEFVDVGTAGNAHDNGGGGGS